MSGPKVQPNFSIPPGIASDPLFLDFVEQLRKRLTDIAGVINAGQFPGTPTNDNAQAGDVGECISSFVPSTSAVALVTGVGKDVTTIVLTPGDWNVAANIGFTGGATTNVTFLTGSISAVANTNDGINGRITRQVYPGGAVLFGTATPFQPIQSSRWAVSSAGNQTLHLVATAAFTVSTCSAFGLLQARRVR